MSWIIRHRESGRAVMEVFTGKLLPLVNTRVYEVVPTLRHLQDLNNPSTAAYRAARNVAALTA